MEKIMKQKNDIFPIKLKADLLLIHPPSFYDFRDRRDIYFPFLGTSGDVPITPLYEYFPVGFKTLQRFLSNLGYVVRIINISTVLLRFPKIKLEKVIKEFDAKLLGIDLHWMVHVQGSLSLAELIKKIHCDTPIILGGLSSTYYANQLINYSFIDMVMRGYDTHLPMASLLEAINNGSDLSQIPNLLWRSKEGEIHDNGYSYTPNSFGCGIDWTDLPQESVGQSFPILELLSTRNIGCAYNCSWCGGSRDASRRIFKHRKPVCLKQLSETRYEFDSMKRLPGIERYHFYSVGFYNEPRKNIKSFLELVAESNIKSISYEQFHLTPISLMKLMVKANKRTIITLSPESHDLRIAKLAGRGVYTNEELELWINRAFDCGVYQIDIWYFIGMPNQDKKSVMETVEYCRRILRLFKGRRVNPMICPMIPLLDPGSNIFEDPNSYGYRVFYRTVEDHRRGMENASIINRINYETKWLSRSDLIYVGFEAVRQLMEAKAEFGLLPSTIVKDFNSRINDAIDFIPVVHRADSIVDKRERARQLQRLGDEILRRNDSIFFSGVMNQAFPINRRIGGRWFDELGWDSKYLEKLQ